MELLLQQPRPLINRLWYLTHCIKNVTTIGFSLKIFGVFRLFLFASKTEKEDIYTKLMADQSYYLATQPAKL